MTDVLSIARLPGTMWSTEARCVQTGAKQASPRDLYHAGLLALVMLLHMPLLVRVLAIRRSGHGAAGNGSFSLRQLVKDDQDDGAAKALTRSRFV